MTPALLRLHPRAQLCHTREGWGPPVQGAGGRMGAGLCVRRRGRALHRLGVTQAEVEQGSARTCHLASGMGRDRARLSATQPGAK